MNPIKSTTVSLLAGCVAGAVLCSAPAARANVYATNIKFNGNLTNATANVGSPVSISYILNEAATLGVTVNILSNVTVIDTITIASGGAGTLRGLNTVSWGATNSAGASVPIGAYSASITASAAGYTNWTQTSLDSSNTVSVFSHGIAVDNNPTSLFYGRVILGNDTSATQHGVSQKVGFYKMNADSSPADEGTFGFAGYTTNDNGQVAVGQMASAGTGVGNALHNPYVIRVAEDDRIYWADDSNSGAIVSCDMMTTTNQIVICAGPGNPGASFYASAANVNNPHNFSGNPDGALLDQGGVGISQFDVINANTTNAAIFLVDMGDYANWGVWMFHLTNGMSDTNDIVGTQAVATGGDIGFVTGSGVSVDTNLDIFVSQNRSNVGDNNNRTVAFTNWNGGVLPPGGRQFDFSLTSGSEWAVGAFDNSSCNIRDTVIDSRTHPKFVALPMLAGGTGTTSGGIRVLNAMDGSIVTVTNADSSLQSLTNIDYPNQYSCAAWDNVGNLYGASTSANYWRVWSPPGTNTNTTVAVATVQLIVPAVAPTITKIAINGTNVTINFRTGVSGDLPSAFTLISSGTIVPASGYAAVSGAVVTQVSPGVFQATATTSGSTRFYRIKR